jgi:hypothetical protein
MTDTPKPSEPEYTGGPFPRSADDVLSILDKSVGWGKPSEPTSEARRRAWQVPLWKAIARHAQACRGDMDRHYIGRMGLVVEIESIVERAIADSPAPQSLTDLAESRRAALVEARATIEQLRAELTEAKSVPEKPIIGWEEVTRLRADLKAERGKMSDVHAYATRMQEERGVHRDRADALTLERDEAKARMVETEGYWKDLVDLIRRTAAILRTIVTDDEANIAALAALAAARVITLESRAKDADSERDAAHAQIEVMERAAKHDAVNLREYTEAQRTAVEWERLALKGQYEIGAAHTTLNVQRVPLFVLTNPEASSLVARIDWLLANRELLRDQLHDVRNQLQAAQAAELLRANPPT